jgi:hypothetical protein
MKKLLPSLLLILLTHGRCEFSLLREKLWLGQEEEEGVKYVGGDAHHLHVS